MASRAWRPSDGFELTPPLMFNPDHHHQVEQAVLAPASQPAHLPVIEAGTQLYRATEAEELRFQHCLDRGADQHIHCSGEERSQARIANSGKPAIQSIRSV